MVKRFSVVPAVAQALAWKLPHAMDMAKKTKTKTKKNNGFHHINRFKKKNHKIISVDTEIKLSKFNMHL